MSVRGVMLALCLSAAIGASDATLAWLMDRVSDARRVAARQPTQPPMQRPQVEVAPPHVAGAARQRDLRGNEIVRPVAKYRLNRQGTLYEVHSPGTQVPRLGAPQL
jgi:hypothetical protein